MKTPLLPLLALFATLCSAVATRAEETPTIAVIPKGTTHVFWKTVEAGAREAGKELGVNIVWKGPLKEDDRAQQIGIVQQFVSAKVQGIVLAPLDDTALRTPVAAAKTRGIPVVIFDSPLKGEAGSDFVSLVATDNHRGGELAGDELARLLDGKGKIVLLRYSEGSASTAAREAGFLAAVVKHPGLEVTVTNRYGGATASSAQDAAMNLIDRIRDADAIFTPNESTTQGMLLALRQTGLAGKKKFVGFDSSPSLLGALQAGHIQALVAQNPKRMGYLAVKTIVAHLRGEVAPAAVDTGCALVTSANRATPEVKAVLGE